MLAALGSAIDLFLKLLIWEDGYGKVWISSLCQSVGANRTTNSRSKSGVSTAYALVVQRSIQGHFGGVIR
jgi:hypothetical protein